MTTATHSPGTHRERGQSLVEFALVFLAVATMLMMVIDLGRGVYAYTVMSAAASEGARYGIINPTDVAGIMTTAQARAVAVDLNQMTVTVIYPDAVHVQVQVQYVFVPISPLISAVMDGGSLTLSSVARMRI